MRKPAARRAATFATATLLAGLTFLAGALSCSLIVNGNLPPIVYCVPDTGAAVCGSGQVCAPRPTGTQWNCVPRCTNTPCGSGETCDSDKGWCVPVIDGPAAAEASDGSLDVGTPEAPNDVGPMTEAEADVSPDVHVACTGFGCGCSTNTDCERPFACADKQAITEDIWNAWMVGGVIGDAGFCAKPCCTSGDCDFGDGGSGASVCFATGAGGNYCVPSSLLGDRSSTIGTLGGGQNCMGGMCRSGLCLLDSGVDSGVCADTCCSANPTGSNKQCAGQTLCRFDSFPGGGFDVHESANCGVPSQMSFVTTGNACMANSDCYSNLCVPSGLMFPQSMCEDPCRNANDHCLAGFSRTTACEYVQPNPMMTTEIVAACVPVLRNDDAGVAVCFVDDQNSSTGDCSTGERCRPEQLTVGSSSYSVLGCGM